MARLDQLLLAFNRGKVSPLGLGRVEVKRIAMAAETQTNYLPRVLGSMSMRPGMQYLGSTKTYQQARFVPFIYAVDDTALIEFTNLLMRIWVNDSLITRVGPSFTIPALTAWTDNDEAGAASTVAAGYIHFVGTGTNAAIRDALVPCANPGIEHAIRIVVDAGPVTLRIGTSTTDDSYVNETTLRRGIHSIAFTPSADFNIRLLSRRVPQASVTSVTAESSGTVEITSPFATANLEDIRYDQSGNIIFIACDGLQQRMVERRDNNSWSIVFYEPEDGPFKTINDGPIQISSSATTGNVTLTATKPLFRTTHVGCLFQLVSVGQYDTKTLAAQNTFTDGIVVEGTGTNRTFTIILAGSWTTTTVTLQRSIGNTGVWEDVSAIGPWTANVTTSYADGLDNQTVAYRLGIKTGAYGAGDSIACTLSIATGSASGVARVTGYTSSTVVSAEVLDALGSVNATDLWKEGAWSDESGWPTAVAFHEGRLFWAGNAMVWGSIPDSYDSFDPDVVGDAGTIGRSIGSGPVDRVCWIVSSQRLLLGTQSAEYSIRASTLDEPLTPALFVMRVASSQGSSFVDPVKIDNRIVFIQRNGSKVYELSIDTRVLDYTPKDLTAINPEIGYPGLVRIVVQRQPDTRIHCIRSDGTVAILIEDKIEEMLAWTDIETDGDIEDAVILPAPNGELDDHVYYVVKRTINGNTVRFLEKWAQQTECNGGTLNKQADAFVVKTPASATITGLSHLEGEFVAVWADGDDVGTGSDYSMLYQVSGGQITVGSVVAQCVVGLPYTAQFKGMKLGGASQDLGAVIGHDKNINHISLILAHTHSKGIRFGPDFDNLDSMPGMEYGIPAGSQVYSQYDEKSIEFPGTWGTDSRVCLQSQAPRPCTVLAVSLALEMP